MDYRLESVITQCFTTVVRGKSAAQGTAPRGIEVSTWPKIVRHHHHRRHRHHYSQIIIERWRKVPAINKLYDKLNVRSFVLPNM